MSARRNWQAVVRLPTVYVLIVANLYPLAGLLFLGWRPGSLMVLYIAEAIVVYLYTAVMLAIIGGERASLGLPKFLLGAGIAIALMTFLSLAGSMAADPSTDPEHRPGRLDDWLAEILSDPEILISGALLFFSHTVSFFVDFLGRGEYKRLDWESVASRMRPTFLTLFLTPFGLGAFAYFRSPVAFAGFVVLLKTCIDLAEYALERSRDRTPSGTVGP
jgi:hypothetical protein